MRPTYDKDNVKCVKLGSYQKEEANLAFKAYKETHGSIMGWINLEGCLYSIAFVCDLISSLKEKSSTLLCVI